MPATPTGNRSTRRSLLRRCYGSEAEFLQLSEAGKPGGNLHLLPDTTVIAKAGPNPTIVHRPGGDRIVVPVPPVTDIRDLTGAGDAFAAGFLQTYLRTKDLHDACVGGHAAAAQVLSSPGATLPTELIAKNTTTSKAAPR